MREYYGPLKIPATAPGIGETLTDPAIDTLLSFFVAILNANGDTAWQAVNDYQPGGDHVVVSTFSYNPEEEDGTSFNTRDLPALFMWRSEIGGSDWIAADWYVRKSTFTLLWVPPPAAQATRALWRPFINLVASVLDGVTDPDGRDPSWIQPNDPDPAASYLGSLLWKYIPYIFRFEIKKTEPARVKIKIDTDAASFPCVKCTIDFWERNEIGEPPDAYFELLGADISVGDAGSGTMPGPDALVIALGVNVASVSPSSGPSAGGTAVTIQGTGFGSAPAVSFGPYAATGVIVPDDTTLYCTTPGTGSGGVVSVKVDNGNGDSWTLPNAFTFT